MEEGRRFLENEFGVYPTIGWQLDPFGHTQTNADIFAQVGIDTLVFARWSVYTQSEKLKNKEMQWIWETSDQNSLFAHYLVDHYSPPFPIDYWWETFDDIDNVSIQNHLQFNTRVEKIKNYAMNHSKRYKTPQVLLMYGEDFSHVMAYNTYDFMNQVIYQISADSHKQVRLGKTVNQFNPKLKIRYATITEYINAVQEYASEKNIKWPVHKYDD